EAVLRDVLETGPRGLRELLGGIAVHLNAAPLAQLLRDRFSDSGSLSSRESPLDPLWWCVDCLRFRYFWHDLISDQEKSMLLNGDWAMFNTPTADYSMALAQWWRVLESILKRGVVRELSQLFQQ